MVPGLSEFLHSDLRRRVPTSFHLQNDQCPVLKFRAYCVVTTLIVVTLSPILNVIVHGDET